MRGRARWTASEHRVKHSDKSRRNVRIPRNRSTGMGAAAPRWLAPRNGHRADPAERRGRGALHRTKRFGSEAPARSLASGLPGDSLQPVHEFGPIGRWRPQKRPDGRDSLRAAQCPPAAAALRQPTSRGGDAERGGAAERGSRGVPAVVVLLRPALRVLRAAALARDLAGADQPRHVPKVVQVAIDVRLVAGRLHEPDCRSRPFVAEDQPAA